MVSFDICDGNPGALTFMIQAYDKAPFPAEAAFRKMQDNGIHGSDLYLIWNDINERDVAEAIGYMANTPIDEIIKALVNIRGDDNDKSNRRGCCGSQG